MKLNKKDQKNFHDLPPPNVVNVLCPVCNERMRIRSSREVYAYHKAYLLHCKRCAHKETRIEKILWSVSDDHIDADGILNYFTPSEISKDLYVHLSNLMLMDLFIRSNMSSHKKAIKKLKRELLSVRDKYKMVLDIACGDGLTSEEINRHLKISSEISHAGVRAWIAKHRDK